jgi:hypothetical protein
MSRRQLGPRAKTIAVKRITREELRIGRLMYPPVDIERPQTREDCRPGGANEMRPCPWVACKHNLYLDINPKTGSIKFNRPDREPWEVTDSCSLDIAERGARTLEDVAATMNLTRERARQVEVHGLLKLKFGGHLEGDELGGFAKPEGDTHESMGDGPSWSTDEDSVGDVT